MKRIIIKQHTTQLYIAKSVCRERYVVLVGTAAAAAKRRAR